jgi:hypothetical protein
MIETVAQRTVSRLRRTNDRSVLLVHEDHEDDENAENEVVQRSQPLTTIVLCGVLVSPPMSISPSG